LFCKIFHIYLCINGGIMTPYTIALAGKAYLTQANRSGKIQQTTGKSILMHSDFRFYSKAMNHSDMVLEMRSLPYPHSIANIPGMKPGNKENAKGYPGIRNNFNLKFSAVLHATTNFCAFLGNSLKLYLDTVHLTTGFDVIVSRTLFGKGNYKLMPVLLIAR